MLTLNSTDLFAARVYHFLYAFRLDFLSHNHYHNDCLGCLGNNAQLERRIYIEYPTMAKTRATKATSKKKDEAESTPKPTLKKLEASVENPPQLFVLPKDASSEARIATISNPATSAPNRYFVCPEKGFYEFTRVAAPKKQHRSWLLAPDQNEQDQDTEAEAEDNGYVLQSPDMFVATPVDPLFLLLPALADDGESGGQEFLASSDFLAKLTNSSPHLAQILHPSNPEKLERCLEARIETVSDCMDMGDEKMYSLALPKLVKEVVSKAKRMTAKGLPASMEDRFVKQDLDVPVLSMKREESSISIAADDATGGAESQPAWEEQSQESAASGTTAATVSTEATSVTVTAENDAQSAPASDVVNLLRIKVALDFLLTSYVPSSLRKKLQPLISDPQTSGVDFSSLEKHLERIASLKKEAQALRSLSDNISRKRSAMDDDEALEKAEAKKRKKEEEELKKKNTSQGVKKLMKADTSGMKKLSSFFSKAPAKK